MNLEQILGKYDAMFGRYKLEEIEAYLKSKIQEAREQKEQGIEVSLLNEMIGLCRDTTQGEKALNYCGELMALLKDMDLKGQMPYATSLLNIANAYRAFGLHEKSIKLFEEVEETYQHHIAKDDFMHASLYNNWALVYQETEAYEEAAYLLRKSLEIVDLYDEALIPQATTRTNLATSLIGVGTEKSCEEAVRYLHQAMEIHKRDGGTDFHYGATLVAMGDAYSHQGDYQNARTYYQMGLDEIEKHTGKNDNYRRVFEKLEYVQKKIGGQSKWQSNLERSRKFYETYGKPMLQKYFQEYLPRIAVGMVGEGSDCFGFDDEISTDHDYEIGFCMWLTEDDFRRIGEKLQEHYEKIAPFQDRLRERRGVFSINQFYNGILGTRVDYESGNAIPWERLQEHSLATATDGLVFQDEIGNFTRVRNQLLSYYPERIWRKKLAQGFHDFSQYAQSNYSRMMARNDQVTSMMCVGKAIESTLDLVYLLEKKYAPYYKWKKKGLEHSELAARILPVLETIARAPNQRNVWEGYRYSAASVHTEDANVALFESIAQMLLEELKKQNLVSGSDLFLEGYIPQILEGKEIDIINRVIEEEWNQFDQVKNEGGRADCQDNFETFQIMRKSQYRTWTKEMLESYLDDLQSAGNRGWNLIMEKYARMMKSTNPGRYAELESQLPVICEKRSKIQEEVIRIQVSWMEECAARYPKLAGNMRSVRTKEDNQWNTSYETYLRGEISTYSERTFVLYTNFIIEHLKADCNLAMEILQHTVNLYGYDSLDDAERKQNQVLF